MLGAAGILVPDLFHSIGAGGPAAQVRPCAEAAALLAATALQAGCCIVGPVLLVRYESSPMQDPCFYCP